MGQRLCEALSGTSSRPSRRCLVSAVCLRPIPFAIGDDTSDDLPSRGRAAEPTGISPPHGPVKRLW